MLPNEYVGLNFKTEFSQSVDEPEFVEIGKVYNLSPSNDSDEVTRNWLDGSSQKWQTNYSHSIEATISKLTAENIKALVPQNVYEAGASIDGTAGVTAGEDGVIQVGEPIMGATTVNGIFKLTPVNGSQKPIYMLNATVSITDMTMDDNLAELTVTISADKLLIGNLNFNGETS